MDVVNGRSEEQEDSVLAQAAQVFGELADLTPHRRLPEDCGREPTLVAAARLRTMAWAIAPWHDPAADPDGALDLVCQGW
jgi:hypothetical protein